MFEDIIGEGVDTFDLFNEIRGNVFNIVMQYAYEPADSLTITGITLDLMNFLRSRKDITWFGLDTELLDSKVIVNIDVMHGKDTRRIKYAVGGKK